MKRNFLLGGLGLFGLVLLIWGLLTAPVPTIVVALVLLLLLMVFSLMKVC